MRTRTILVSLLAVYAVVSTAYFVFHTGATTTSRVRTNVGAPSRSAEADVNLPVAPPFNEPNQPASDGRNLIARAQLESELRYTDLQSFICSERMERYKGKLDGEKGSQIDTVNARVSFENGVENYTGIQQNNRTRGSMSSIAGAWSEGEFGTLLRQTRTLLGTQPVTIQQSADVDGVPALIYRMDVSGLESPWDLVVKSQSFRVPFRTEVTVGKANGQIMQIKRTSMAMPPDSGISEIQWSVVLKPIQMDGKVWLLPNTGQYSVLYQELNRREWNVINFSDYHRYTATSVMHF